MVYVSEALPSLLRAREIRRERRHRFAEFLTKPRVRTYSDEVKERVSQSITTPSSRTKGYPGDGISLRKATQLHLSLLAGRTYS